MKNTLKQSLLPCAALLAGLVAAPLPAAAGPDSKPQRLEISTKEGVTAPDAKAILHVLLGDQEGGQREVRLLRTKTGSTLQIDVRGATLPADSADKLRAMFPALKDAQITLGAGGGDGQPPLPPLPPLDGEKDPAKIKAMIEKRLAAEGKTGTVNVTVVEKDGKKEIKVSVEAEAEKATK
jgi:phosphoribosylformylglycinamidine (FGAM) synthase PurS component